jgi:hypothetical protein
LEARRLASARERVVDVECGERGAESAATGVRERSEVVDAAVAVVVMGHRGRDVLAVEARDEEVVGARVGPT